MPKRDDSVYLRHILDSIERIQRYIEGATEEDFLTDELLQDGVIRQLSLIGEAVKRLSEDVYDQHPRVPWRDIVGMRDKLVDDYFGVDLGAVWNTATGDLAPMKEAVKDALADLNA